MNNIERNLGPLAGILCVTRPLRMEQTPRHGFVFQFNAVPSCDAYVFLDARHRHGRFRMRYHVPLETVEVC